MVLAHGHDFFGELPDADSNFQNDLDRQREVWSQIGEQVMQEWITDRNRAGHRPIAWWLFSRPGDPNEIESESQALFRFGVLELWEIATLDGWGVGWRNKQCEFCDRAIRKTMLRDQREEFHASFFDEKLFLYKKTDEKGQKA